MDRGGPWTSGTVGTCSPLPTQRTTQERTVPCSWVCTGDGCGWGHLGHAVFWWERGAGLPWGAVGHRPSQATAALGPREMPCLQTVLIDHLMDAPPPRPKGSACRFAKNSVSLLFSVCTSFGPWGPQCTNVAPSLSRGLGPGSPPGTRTQLPSVTKAGAAQTTVFQKDWERKRVPRRAGPADHRGTDATPRPEGPIVQVPPTGLGMNAGGTRALGPEPA